jgi:putative iron-dependent peroxidase
MENYQTGILQPVPEQALYLTCNLHRPVNQQQVIKILQSVETNDNVIGLGQSLLDRFDRSVVCLKTMPTFTSSHINSSSATSDLWCWLRGSDRGELLHRSRRIVEQLSPAFELTDLVDAFRFAEGRDLTGYEDGTENPVGDAALKAAILNNSNTDVNGSSYVAVQQWQHDLDVFETFSEEQQDNIIGRRRSDNYEIEDAPQSAHVKRTAQESFDPEAFLLRRSMPWGNHLQAGLMFVAFGHSFDAFEAQFNRMIGREDGIEDSLFQFSSVINGAYYWCPPIIQGQLNLTAINEQSGRYE